MKNGFSGVKYKLKVENCEYLLFYSYARTYLRRPKITIYQYLWTNILCLLNLYLKNVEKSTIVLKKQYKVRNIIGNINF